jgi:hypothetical protein
MTIWDETRSGKIKNLFNILDAPVSSTGQAILPLPPPEGDNSPIKGEG